MLLDALQEKLPFKSVLEIGCGIGTLLDTASRRQIKVIGYDSNPFAVRYGKENFGIDLRSELWDSRTLDYKNDLVISISVMEHLEAPRTLLKEIAEYCLNCNSSAYISVPFLEFDRWHYLFDPDPLKEGTPFFDNDSHVTHFSRYGFVKMCKQFGAKSELLVTTKGWSGYLVAF